jgi:hypothetical protein
MSKQIPQWWEVVIYCHDEWSGVEVVDHVAFALDEHNTAKDYVYMLTRNSRDMGEDRYWTVSDPKLTSANGLWIADKSVIYYNGMDYFQHLLDFEADKVDFRLPSNEL